MRRIRIAVAVLCTLALLAGTVAAGEQDEIVLFNTSTHKYHCRTCSHAKRCTTNCIELTLSEAKARGGVACKVCGGTCRTEVER